MDAKNAFSLVFCLSSQESPEHNKIEAKCTMEKCRRLKREKQSALAVVELVALVYSDLVSVGGGGNGDSCFVEQWPGFQRW